MSGIKLEDITKEEISNAFADAAVAATHAVAQATATANANGFKADRVVTEGYLQANYAQAHDYNFCLREINFCPEGDDLSAFSVQELASILDPNGCDLAMMPLIKFPEHSKDTLWDIIESTAKAIVDVVLIVGWDKLKVKNKSNGHTKLYEEIYKILTKIKCVGNDKISTASERIEGFIIKYGDKEESSVTHDLSLQIKTILQGILPGHDFLNVSAANIARRLKDLGLPIDVTIWFDNDNLKSSVKETKFITELTNAGYSVGYYGGSDCGCPQGNGNMQNGSIVLDNVQCGPKTEAGGGIQTFTIGDNSGACKIRWIKPQ